MKNERCEKNAQKGAQIFHTKQKKIRGLVFETAD